MAEKTLLERMAAEPCENFTFGTCADNGRTPDARYLGERSCPPCRLRAALADPDIEVRPHVCAACRWEQGFGARKPLEHTCAARKGQPAAPDVDLDEHHPEGYPVLPKQCLATWTSPTYGVARCKYAAGHDGVHRDARNPFVWIANLPGGGLPDDLGAHWLPAEDGS